MTHCCSQCSFSAKFESALKMHHQLHHETLAGDSPKPSPRIAKTKAQIVSRVTIGDSNKDQQNSNNIKNEKSLGKTSSATRLIGMLRSKISKSKVLFSHPEEPYRHRLTPSEYTSNAPDGSIISEDKEFLPKEALTETFACHLCPFDADRITVLDRHLLNDHKIGLDNLLKLVMAKTRDGLSEDLPNPALYDFRQPYYKPQDEIIEEGDFVIENVTSKLKILRHASTNTDIKWADFPILKDVKNIAKELQDINFPSDSCDKEDLLKKMHSLNEIMCKYADSANTLKKLTKGFGSKLSIRDLKLRDESFTDIEFGNQESPTWEKPRSERYERQKHRFDDGIRSEKSKFNSDSFYY